MLGLLALPAQAADAFTGLGFLGTGTHSGAYGVSADGSVVVGFSNNSYNGSDYEAFRWTNNGMTGLGFLGTGSYSEAYGVSADGSVVVGVSDNGTYYEAFRWTNNVMTGLGFLGTGWFSEALGVSADGSVVVGSGYNGSNTEAFRWTNNGMTGLGFLGTGSYSEARGVSADGSVVVGESHNGNSTEAFRWTNNVMTGLGFLGTGWSSSAYGVSADGSVVVGESYNGSNTEAFRWTQTTNMQSVAAWLAGAGVTVPAGLVLERASGVSADGNVLVGDGSNNQAWLARVGPAGAGLLTDINAFNSSLIEAGARGVQAGAALPNLTMFGAHHRSILDNGLVRTSEDGGCAWVTVDAGRHNKTDSRMEIAEVGACKDISTARVGLGIGQAWSRQDLSLGGDSRFNGQYLIAEAANAFANGLEASFTGYYGRFDTDISRNYMNGATVDSSKASPDSRAYAARARMDWKDAATIGRFSLSPYAAYTWMQTKMDSYTETGGGFPAHFSAATWRTQDIRLGAAAKTALAANTDLRLGLEAVHRIDANTDGVKVQVIGLGMLNQNLPGQSVNQSWVRTTLDVDHRFTDNVALTVGANAASSGGDATWGVTAGLRANF
ncbi:MAG: autotransporter domain-containing protein [Methylotenera sp.]|nr:autotransporter domain-containing protein [Methylotenera sp.]